MNHADHPTNPIADAARPLPGDGEALFLAAFERELAATVTRSGGLDDIARPLVLAPAAKRARPLVAWLVGEVCGADPRTVMDVAIAVELVHAASLLHDDVVDGASERRGLPSANARWGATLAVLSGDLLLTAALARVARLGEGATARAVEGVAEMTRAVAAELGMRRRLDVPIAAWRAMAEGKTGALFGVAARLVAASTGEGARAERFERALRHLGVAFQIADDCGDVSEDLGEGNASLPVLLAAREPATRARLASAPPDEAAALVLASGAVEAASCAARSEVAAARALLAPELAAPPLARLFAWAETLTTAATAAPGDATPRAAPVYARADARGAGA